LGTLGEVPFIGASFEEGHYHSVHATHCAFVGTPEEFVRMRAALQRAHLDFVRRAATKTSGEPIAGSPHRKSHSEELLAFAREEIGTAVADQSPEGILDRGIFARTDIGPTQKQTLVNARRGQGLFRERVIQLEGKCRVTGINLVDHLRASHIKPWKASTDLEKLDGNNGLLLAPHIDHLFDQGYISFTDIGDVVVSPKCPTGLLKAWGIDESMNVGPSRSAQRPYLAHHRAHVLKI
jgi:hypothetical protein